MSQDISISESEWQVMEVLWSASPKTAGEVIEALTSQNWNHRTIRTLLSRLVKKEVLEVEVLGRDYLYSPAVKRADCTHQASEHFLQRFFKGRSSDLLLHFIEESDLSSNDIEELERLLHNKKKQRPSK